MPTCTYHSSPQVKTEYGVVDRILSHYHIIYVFVFSTHIYSLTKASNLSNLLSHSSLPSTQDDFSTISSD